MAAYNRVIVIGCPGSGKSTFSVKLSEKTGIPVTHLDRLYWEPGWVCVSKTVFDRRLAEALKQERWIMDGNYIRTIPLRLERCDAVVWLDLPRSACMIGAVGRILKNLGRTRPDMGDGCRERFDLSFLKYIWNFNAEQRESIRTMLECAQNARIFTVRTRRELPAVLEELTRERGEEYGTMETTDR